MTWETALQESWGQLLASFVIGYALAFSITAFKKFMDMI